MSVEGRRRDIAIAIGRKIRQLREQKGFSQADINRTTGMLRGYISRVEKGHTVPSLETLQRFAGVLGIPMSQLFRWEGEPEDLAFLALLKTYVHRLPEPYRVLLLDLARRLASR